MKRILSILLVMMAIFYAFPDLVQGRDNSHVQGMQAESWILIDQDSGKVLDENRANVQMYPASTTKIITALIALENAKLDEVVTVGNEINLVHRDGSKAGLHIGQRIKLKDLVMGLMLPSGNDAADVIAVHIGRKIAGNPRLPVEEAIWEFVSLMNEKAKEIGAKDTHFMNPHGYQDANHYTTAHDLALIARAAQKDTVFREIVQTSSAKGWTNLNELINKHSQYYYPYATGLKTGHTTRAGYCLVSSATKENTHLIAAVLNSTQEGQWSDSVKLLEYGFDNDTKPPVNNLLTQVKEVVKTMRGL